MSGANPGREEISRLALEAEVARSLRSAAFDKDCELVGRFVEVLLPVVAVVGERWNLIDEAGNRAEDEIGALVVIDERNASAGVAGEALVLDERGVWHIVKGPRGRADVLRPRDRVSLRHAVYKYGSWMILPRLFDSLLREIERRRPDAYDDLVERVAAVAAAYSVSE